MINEPKIFRIKFFFSAAIFHPLLVKVFKHETTSFPKDSESLKIMDMRLWVVGANQRLNGTSKGNRPTNRQKNRQTNRHMDRHFEFKKASALWCQECVT